MTHAPISPDMIRDFNEVLCGEKGERVFTRILMDLGLFRMLETPEDITKHNYAIQLLIYAGVCSPYKRPAMIRNILTKRTIRRMFKLRLPVEEAIGE